MVAARQPETGSQTIHDPAIWYGSLRRDEQNRWVRKLYVPLDRVTEIYVKLADEVDSIASIRDVSTSRYGVLEVTLPGWCIAYLVWSDEIDRKLSKTKTYTEPPLTIVPPVQALAIYSEQPAGLQFVASLRSGDVWVDGKHTYQVILASMGRDHYEAVVHDMAYQSIAMTTVPSGLHPAREGFWVIRGVFEPTADQLTDAGNMLRRLERDIETPSLKIVETNAGSHELKIA